MQSSLSYQEAAVRERLHDANSLRCVQLHLSLFSILFLFFFCVFQRKLERRKCAQKAQLHRLHLQFMQAAGARRSSSTNDACFIASIIIIYIYNIQIFILVGLR